MNLEELKQAVKELAKGEYHRVAHKITECHTGEVVNAWEAYIYGLGLTPDCNSSGEALKVMERMYNSAQIPNKV